MVEYKETYSSTTLIDRCTEDKSIFLSTEIKPSVCRYFVYSLARAALGRVIIGAYLIKDLQLTMHDTGYDRRQ